MAAAEPTKAGGMPAFVRYSSLQPDRSAAVVAERLRAIAAHSKLPPSVASALEAVATPKIHGCSFQVTASADGSVVYGRRSAYLAADESFYGYVDTMRDMGMADKAQAALRTVRLGSGDGAGDGSSGHALVGGAVALTVFGELYGGGVYPHADVPPAKPQRKAVQAEIKYGPLHQFVAFDVLVRDAGGSGGFLDFADAASLCESVGIPVVPAVKTGPLDEVCAWAAEHAADNALAHYNPYALPLLPGNAGEGWVVRLRAEAAWGHDRALAKIKNPTFREVAAAEEGATTGAGAGTGKRESKPAPGASLVARYATAARAAAVASKASEAELAARDAIQALAAAFVADVEAEETWAADVAKEGEDKAAIHKTLKTAAFAAVKAHLKSV